MPVQVVPSITHTFHDGEANVDSRILAITFPSSGGGVDLPDDTPLAVSEAGSASERDNMTVFKGLNTVTLSRQVCHHYHHTTDDTPILPKKNVSNAIFVEPTDTECSSHPYPWVVRPQ